MSSRLLLRPTTVVLASLLAWTLVVRAAAPIKDWKDGTNGKATDKDNWKDGVKPGNSDVARISSGKVIVNEPAAAPLTILGLELSGTGTLEGGGTLSLLGISGVLSANSSWTGGDVDNVTVNTSSSATFTIGAGATKNLKNGAKLNLLGNTTWSGGDVSATNGAQIANTGNFTVTGGGKIGHDTTLGGSRATFTNNGTLTKNTSADLTELESVFNNNASVTVSTGTLKLKGGGTHASTGNVTVATGATLAVSDNDYTFNGGIITGAGTLEFSGATTTFNGTSAANAQLKVNGGTAKFNQSHSTNGRLALSSGAVDGASGTTTTVGGLDWTGGDITTTNVTTNGTNTIGNGATKRLLNGSQLTLGGNTQWDGSTIETTGSTAIINQSGVTFSASGDGSLTYNGTGTRAVFTNNGTFTKDAGGTSGTEVQTKFDNNGTVNANGRLNLVGGGTNTGSFNIGNDATVTIAGNDYTFNGGTLGGSGTLDLTGATTTFNGTSGSANVRVNAGAGLRLTGNHSSTGNLSLASGTVDGSGTAAVGDFTWNGGLISGATISANNTTIASTEAKQLQSGAQLNLSGNTTWGGGGKSTNINTSGSTTKIRNTGTFTASTDGTIENDSTDADRATFRNEGTFVKASTATGETKIRTKFENITGAAVTVDGGTLNLDGGLASSGNISLADGTHLVLANSGADYTFTAGALTGNGTGAIKLQGATATFGATSGNASVEIAGGSARFNGAHNGSGKLSLQSGQIEGTGTATVGAFEWESGHITGANLTVTGATIGGNGTKKISDGGQLNITGITSWTPTTGESAANNITTGGANTKIRNTGTFTTTTDGTLAHDTASDGRATFRNEGTFQKTNTPSGGATRLETVFENAASGLVQIDGGSLQLVGGGSSSGNVTVAGGANIVLADHDYTFNGGTLAGSGSIDLESATATFNGTSGTANLHVKGGNAKFAGTHTTSGTLRLESGLIEGNSTATVGSLDWSGGNITGATVAANGTVISGERAKKISDGAQLNLSGNTSWTSDNILTAGNNTLLRNTGRFSITNDGTIGNDDTAANRATFRNEGTLTKSNTTSGGTTELQTKFDNIAGASVQIDGGKFKLTGGGTNQGTVSVASGASIEIATTDFAFAGGTVNGDGTIDITSATATFNGTSGNAHLKVNGGQAKFDGNHTSTGTLTLASGNITGAGHAMVGTFDWQSGTLDSKVTASGATLGRNSKTLGSAADLTLLGNTTWDGSSLHADGNGKIKNSSGATFTVSADGDFTNGGTAVFTNNGTFEKTAGSASGATNLSVRFESDGEIKANTGTLKFSGGGRSANNITLGTDATVEILGADFEISGGAINGSSGKLRLSDKTTTFKNTTSGSAEISISSSTATARFDGNHTGTGKLALSGGTVTGNGTAEFGSLQFTGGTLAGNVKSNGATTLGGGAKTLSGELTLGGDTSWDSSTLHADSTGKIKNTATFTARGDGALTGSGNASFINSGTFEKASGAGGSTDIYTAFENTGEIKASAGKLKLLGGGTSSNAVTLGDGATLEIAGANYTFTGGAINGAHGKLQLSSATTTFTNSTSGSAELFISDSSATARFDGTHTGSGKLSLASGTITGSGTAEFSTLDWSGGALGATVKSKGNTVISGSDLKSLTGELTLAGNTTWNGSGLHAANNGKIKNELGQTFTVSADGTLSSDGTATFANAGTFEKSAGATGGMTNLQARFENTGHLKASNGTLKLSGGGQSSSQVTIGSGAQLEIFGADFAFTGGAINGSSGKLKLSGNTTTFTNFTSGDAELALSGAATAQFNGAHAGTGKLSLASGTVSGTGSAEFGTLDWSGGTLGARVKTNGNASLSGGLKVLSGELTLDGDTTWDGSSIAASNNGKIKNESARTFTITGDGTLSSDGTATISNAGTFEKAAGNGGATHLNARFDSSGTFKVTEGTLRLLGGGASSGNVSLGSNGKLQVVANNYAFENAAFSGSGTLELEGATTRFKGNSGAVTLSLSGGNADLDTSELTASHLLLSHGSVNSLNGGSANIGSLAWSGGTLNAKVKTAGASLNGSSKTLASGADVTLGGVTNWDGTLIQAQGNARLRNALAGTLLATDGLFANSGTATFANDGTLTKSQGSGSLVFQTRFENNGTVNVDSGKLHLTGGGRNADNASILVKSASELLIDGNLELASNSALTGDGLGRLLSGTLTAHGNVRLKNFSFEGGSLAGSNVFHGAVDWKGGNWNSDIAGVTTTIAANGSLDLRGAAHDFNNRSIFNYGTVNWHSGSLRGGNGSAFVNHSIFNDLNAGNKSLSSASGSASFTNNGEYRKSQGGTTNVDLPFTNNGTIKVSAGSLIFNSTFTNNGALNLTNGASAKFSAPLIFAANSPLSGVGTIDSPQVTAAGQVAPGVSPGALAITGNLTLLNTSSLLIELGGPGQGTGYDFLSVGGAGLLGGSLNVSFLNGYQWDLPAGATFTILTANGGLTGAFANVANGGRISTIDGAATFQVNYGLGASLTNSVVLSNFIVAVPEPSTYALLALGSLVVLFSVRRRGRN